MAELERKAGYGLVIALTLTSMIGTGMFFGPAIAAQYAGTASLISWVLLAIITVYVGTCFAELSSIFPDVGGVYEFTKQAYGRFSSFIIAWITWLVGSITPAVMVVAALDNLQSIVPALGENYFLSLGVAIGLVLFLNYVALRGIEASTGILIFFAVITVGVILAIIGVGAFHINPDNYTPFLFDGTGQPVTNMVFIFVALFFIMETFFGWESATFMGGETKNPEKVIPKSIMITTILVAVIGVLFVFVVLGFIPWAQIGLDSPIADISVRLFGETGVVLVNICIFLALIGSAAGGIVGSPRLILALAKDKLFIAQLSDIHPKYKTPHRAIIFQTLVSIIIILFAKGEYKSLLSLLIPMALIMYIAIIMTVPVLRKKFPDLKRTVKVPFALFGTVLVSLFYLAIIFIWLKEEPAAWSLFKQLLSFILFGFPIYLLLNFYYNPDALFTTVNKVAWLNRLFEGILLPKSVRKKIISLFGSLQGMHVLELGAGVGSLTLPLAESVGKKGRVTAIDFSPNNLAILKKRVKKLPITLIYDKHVISRVHPDVGSVDAVFSVGNLSYIQDLGIILSELKNLLPENGRVCFVEYVDYFWGAIPDQAWLDNEELLKKTFREAGFSVRIIKEKGLFWKYLTIYGIKSDEDVPYI